MEEITARVQIDRPVYQQNSLDSLFERQKEEPNTFLSRKSFRNVRCDLEGAVKRAIPSIVWLSNYDLKACLIRDIIAGCTVAIMNIPQGMAYALLGNVPPVVGIYMAFFPVIVYSFLGTSRHISMGSFAVICLMTGKVVSTYTSTENVALNVNGTYQEKLTPYSAIEVGTAVTFMVAIYQLLMYIFRLGIVCTLLSDTLINGFTSAAAIHVLTSQIKDLFGIRIPSYNGTLHLIYTYIYLFGHLEKVNLAATIISLITIAILCINNEVFKPWVSKRSIVPIPIELIAVLTGTLVSAYGGLAVTYNLRTVGKISVGLPEPKIPPFSLFPSIAVDSFVIAIIAYIISVSMALIFAKQLNYEIDPNQELLAQGCGNLVGSFFSCLPFAASLSRSVIQQTVGGCTQITSLVSSGILLVVLLWIAPVFEPLPRCILSSLIVVALKGVLLQACDIIKIWRISPLDGLVWIATYVAVVLVEIDVGLLVGIVASLFTIVVRAIKPKTYILGRLPNTEIYVDITKYSKTEHLPGITIVRYCGCINFVNRSFFKNDIFKLTRRIPNECVKINSIVPQNNPVTERSFLILDFSTVQYIDPSGAECLKSVVLELQDGKTSILVAAMSGTVNETLQNCGVMKGNTFPCFPTVHDAVVFAQSKLDEHIFTIRL